MIVSVAEQIWGSEQSVLNLIPHLAARGIDVTVASPGGGDFGRAAALAGAGSVQLGLPAHRGVVAATPTARSSMINVMSELTKLPSGVRSVRRIIGSADVVHCNSLLANMDCVLAGRLGNRPSVLEIHDLVRPGVSRQLLSTTVRMADASLAVSSAVAANLSGPARRRVRLVPQGVDVERFRPGSAPLVRAELTARPHEPVIAVIGRTDPGKGVHRVVDAVSRLNRAGRPCSLAVVGSPSGDNQAFARRLEQDAATVLGDRVRFVAARSDIPQVLRAVDVVVNASDAEPFGLSVLEAQASGVPVVVGATGGLVDFVADDDTGKLFAVDDGGQLVAALVDVLGSPSTAQRLTTRALTQAVSTFSLAARAEALAALYRQLVPWTAVANP